MGADTLKSVSKGAVLVLVGMAFGGAVEFFVRTLIGRTLGPAQFGVFSIGYAIVAVGSSLSLFGLPQGVTRFIPYYGQKKEPQKVRETILLALKLALAASFLVAFVLFIFSNWIAWNIFHEKSLGAFLKIFIWALPFFALVELNSACLRGFKAVRSKVYSADLLRGLLLGGAAFSLISLKLKGIAIAYISAPLGATLLGFYFLARVFPVSVQKSNEEAAKSESAARSLIGYSWPLAFSTIFSRFQAQIPVFF